MGRIEESPVLKAIRALEDSPVMKAIRQLEDSPVMRAIRELENSPLMEVKRRIEESPALRAIQALENSPAMRVISALTDQLSSFKAGPLTFGEAYQEILLRYERASETPGIDPLNAVATEVEEQARQPSQGPLSTEFYLNLILALFLFWYSQISSNDSEKRILSRIENMECIVTQQLAELRAYEEVDTFYTVERTVNLRIGPNTKSKALALLYPDLKLRLIERAGKWIKVEYFDYLEGHHRSGWVCKKYLKVMNPKKRK